jgi:hypothetical protein
VYCIDTGWGVCISSPSLLSNVIYIAVQPRKKSAAPIKGGDGKEYFEVERNLDRRTVKKGKFECGLACSQH